MSAKYLLTSVLLGLSVQHYCITVQVVGGGRMKYNKAEVAALAQQTGSYRWDQQTDTDSAYADIYSIIQNTALHTYTYI